MYGVLLAEDEMLVRLGLKSSVDWNKYDMYIVADAADGQSAWDIYQRERPEVVITDIRMPGIDGMELIRRIREVSPTTKIVILTCLEDFRLVQQAISLGVSGYFLKLSMTQADLDATFAKLKEELDRNQQAQELGRRNGNPISVEQLFQGFLLYQTHTLAQFQRTVKDLALPLRDGALQVCAMEIDGYRESAAAVQGNGGDIAIASVGNGLNEILAGLGNGIAFHDSAGRFVLVLNVAEGGDPAAFLQTLSQKVRGMLRMYFNSTVTFGVSGVGSGFASLRRLLEEALQALGQKYYLGTGSFFYRDPDQVRQALQRCMDLLGTACQRSARLDTTQRREFQSALESFAVRPHTEQAVRDFLIRQVRWMAGKLALLPGSEGSGAAEAAIGAVEQSASLQQAAEAVGMFLVGSAGATAARRRYSQEIRATLQYIHGKYQQDITLNQVAQSVGLSPGYLSNLFKKEVGDNFISYLNHIRIAKAKELLADSSLKAYDIAGQVGFTDGAYFSKVFKKDAGCSPVQYREQRRGLVKGISDEMEPQADTI